MYSDLGTYSRGTPTQSALLASLSGHGGDAGRQGIASLLGWMDRAAVIVAYNGEAFDMPVLTRYYAGDRARQERHCAKLIDPARAAQRALGRRVRLSTLLARNGCGGKAGAGCDAPGLWQQRKARKPFHGEMT